jgi:hypothetical protein
MEKHRSPKWPEVRAAHLKLHPTCEGCGGTIKLNVHHIQPFHLWPDLELIESNLITLCESRSYGVECHRFFGHLGSYFSWNDRVREQVKGWPEELKNRPKKLKSKK